MRPIHACLSSLLALPFIAFADPVNINSADAATLDRELKGIGPARAAAIVAYRAAHGPFRSIDELALVEGIGQKVIDDNRDQLRVGAGTKPAAKPAAMPAVKPGAARGARPVAPQKPPTAPAR